MSSATSDRRAHLCSVPAALVLVIGTVITLVFATINARTAGYFSTRVQVRLLAPRSGADALDLLTPRKSIIMTAGAVARILSPTPPLRVSDPDATLAGMGVLNGWSVTLPDTGGQWANQFTQPYLDVQVVGADSAKVQARTSELINRIADVLGTLQEQQHVPRRDRITITVTPPGQPSEVYENGSPIRAVAATVALGVALTGLTAFLVRRRTFRWRTRVPRQSFRGEVRSRASLPV